MLNGHIYAGNLFRPDVKYVSKYWMDFHEILSRYSFIERLLRTLVIPPCSTVTMRFTLLAFSEMSSQLGCWVDMQPGKHMLNNFGDPVTFSVVTSSKHFKLSKTLVHHQTPVKQ